MAHVTLVFVLLTYVGFAVVFLLLHRHRPTVLLSSLAAAWLIEAVRTGILLAESYEVALDNRWYGFHDLLYLAVTFCLVNGVTHFAGSAVSKKGWTLYYLAPSVLLLIAARFPLQLYLPDVLQVSQETVTFFVTLGVMSLLLIPGGLIRIWIGKLLFDKARTDPLPAAYITGTLFMVHGLSNLKVPFQWYFHFSMDYLNLAWFMEVFLLSAGVAILVMSKQSIELKATERELLDSLGRFRAFAEIAVNAVVITDFTRNVVFCNHVAQSMFGWDEKDLLGKPFHILTANDCRRAIDEAFEALDITEGDVSPGGYFECDGQRKEGASFPVAISLGTFRIGDNRYFAGLLRDITNRKRSETIQSVLLEISKAADRSETLADLLPVIHRELGRVIDNRNFLVALYDTAKKEYSVPFCVYEYQEGGDSHPQARGRSLADYVRRSGEALLVDETQYRELIDRGETELVGTLPQSWLGAPLKTERGGVIGVMALQNYDPNTLYSDPDVALVNLVSGHVARVIERRQAEDEVRRGRESLTAAERIAHLGNWDWDTVTDDLHWSDEIYRIFGLSPQEFGATSKAFFLSVHPDDREAIADALEMTLSGGEPYNIVHRVVRPDGGIRIVRELGEVTRDHSGKAIRMLGTVQDITESELASRRIQRQLKLLHSLRRIDQTISNSLDTSHAMNLLVDGLVEALDVDAADILIFSRVNNSLVFKVGRGFRSGLIEKSDFVIGTCLSGKMVLDRCILILPDLGSEQTFRSPDLVRAEGFVSYVGVPLIAKGELKGAVELFHRRPFEPDQEWLEFLENFTNQAAVALDNSELFDNLQRSHMELRLAYDATIQGWAKALELRDRETEEHARRVTDMTVRLARLFGFRDEELLYVRWGALLHDVGKIGIPDSILHKPGPLDEPERKLVNQHPTFAYKLFSSISYLRPALEIPYCHHEKWDGSGYPRGLKGQEIPLSARLFAVIDVYDALTSPRPYAEAWPPEKAVEEIRRGSSSHFDPDVVQTFIELLEKE